MLWNVCAGVVVAFVNTKLDESTSSSDETVHREQNIVSRFRQLRRSSTTLDPVSADMASTLNRELSRLGLDIEIIELRDRDSVQSYLCFMLYRASWGRHHQGEVYPSSREMKFGVDLIKLVSMSVRTSVRPSVRPQNVFPI